MGTPDHTAHARPTLQSRVLSRTPLTTQTSPSDLSDANLATFAIVQVMARALSAHSAYRRQDASAQPWLLDRAAINGLSAALKIVNERADALSRSNTEGRSV